MVSKLIDYSSKKGFDGILGMEHGNSIKGERGEKALVDAYLEADSF